MHSPEANVVEDVLRTVTWGIETRLKTRLTCTDNHCGGYGANVERGFVER
jgi:hypothetical protein